MTNFKINRKLKVAGICFSLLFGTLTVDAGLIEKDGLVVGEVEMVPTTGDWVLKTDLDGFSGDSYYEWNGAQLRNGGTGILEFPITITNPGNYQLMIRNRICRGDKATEHNDSFVRMSGVAISGEHMINKNTWYKSYQNGLGLGRWGSQSSIVDGNPQPLRQYFSAGEHTIQISGRSPGHGVDRFVLFKYN